MITEGGINNELIQKFEILANLAEGKKAKIGRQIKFMK